MRGDISPHGSPFVGIGGDFDQLHSNKIGTFTFQHYNNEPIFMTRHTFFTPSTKMAELLSENYTLLTVLPRFDIRFGFGEGTVEQICGKSGADTELFLLVCNLYTFNNYTPAADRHAFRVDELITYLLRSHRYYLCEKIVSIERHLNEIGQEHREILTSFFEEYKREVINHFTYEEQEVFPYIRSLSNGVTSSEYHINRFEENHSNIEDKLGDLKNILIKYLPDDGSSAHVRSELLFELHLFEEELDKHTLIEERVLIPYVELMEREVGYGA